MNLETGFPPVAKVNSIISPTVMNAGSGGENEGTMLPTSVFQFLVHSGISGRAYAGDQRRRLRATVHRRSCRCGAKPRSRDVQSAISEQHLWRCWSESQCDGKCAQHPASIALHGWRVEHH